MLLGLVQHLYIFSWKADNAKVFLFCMSYTAEVKAMLPKQSVNKILKIIKLVPTQRMTNSSSVTQSQNLLPERSWYSSKYQLQIVSPWKNQIQKKWNNFRHNFQDTSRILRKYQSWATLIQNANSWTEGIAPRWSLLHSGPSAAQVLSVKLLKQQLLKNIAHSQQASFSDHCCIPR